MALSFCDSGSKVTEKAYQSFFFFFGLCIHCPQKYRQSRLECFDLHNNFSSLRLHLSKIHYVSQSRLDVQIIEGVEGRRVILVS